MLIKINVFCVWFLSSTIWTIGKTDIIEYSVSDAQQLIDTQRHVIEDLENNIMDRKKDLSFLLRELGRYKQEHRKAKIRVQRYLSNKINRFTFIKRMSKDLEIIKSVFYSQSGLKRNNSLKYPSYNDLQEAVGIIFQLQKMYRLNVRQLADGVLTTPYSGDNKIYKEIFLPMTTSDCFEIGKVMYKDKNYKTCIPWLIEAFRLHENEAPAFGLNKILILQAISRAYDVLNDNTEYIKWTRKLLDLKPKFTEEEIDDLEIMIDIKQMRLHKEYWKENKIPYQEEEWENCKCKNKNNKKCEQKKIKTKKSRKRMSLSKTFEKICRGEIKIGHEVSNKLKCWYFSGHHSFTKLARFRAEQVFIRPDILLIHKVLSDTEIRTIKRMALPQLARNTASKNTMVYHLKTRDVDEQDVVSIKKVMLRIFDMTGLLANNQSLSITRYGIGGENVINVNSSKPKNHHIAPTMLYLSDVEQGGATVFPLLGLSVYPEKGAALYWANQLSLRTANDLTAHGTCPVLRGSKWVATLIDETNQELQKVCHSFKTRRRAAKIYQSLS